MCAVLKSIASPRARPAGGLDCWAVRRGLTPCGHRPQPGYLSVTCPWSEDVLYSVARGPFPAGTEGVICHEVRFTGPSSTPFTSAGLRVPHLGTLTGLHVARRSERPTGPDGAWREHPLELSSCDWVAAVRRHSDPRVVDALLRGPIAELLDGQRAPGFDLRVEYGQVIVSRQTFLATDADLDALVDVAERLADAVRRLCTSARTLAAFGGPLAPPRWLPSVRRHPGDAHLVLPTGARVDRVVAVADERGLAVEDPRAFHTAFGAINVPGEAFAVLRGRLPGTELTGRLLCCAERPLHLPAELAPLLSHPGGIAGCDVAALEVATATPATVPEGEIEGDLRVAIAGGVLTAWRPRRSWQADGPALDRLAADVATIVRRRGL
jgi:hypothetical protein